MYHQETNRDRANGSYSVAFSCFTKTKGKENCRLFDIQTIISSFIAAAVVVVFLSEWMHTPGWDSTRLETRVHCILLNFLLYTAAAGSIQRRKRKTSIYELRCPIECNQQIKARRCVPFYSFRTRIERRRRSRKPQETKGSFSFRL